MCEPGTAAVIFLGPASPSPTSPPGPPKPATHPSVAAITTPTASALPLAATLPVPPPPPRLTDKELASLPADISKQLRLQDTYITCLEDRVSSLEGELSTVREGEERLRAQHAESQQREKVLVRRLAAKEQEMQDVAAQMAELKTSQTATPSALRSALLDPAVNLLLQRLRHELVTARTRLEETQNELSAWKFTPDSNTGKRLMAKCRLLYTENEELGKLTNSGRVAKLEGELALQKSFSEEVKKSQSELDEFLQDLDEDVEGMQSTIYYLQLELRKAKDAAAALEHELASVRCAAASSGVAKTDANNGVDLSPPTATATTLLTTASPPPQQKVNGNCKSACGSRTRGVDSDSEPELIIKVSDKEICDDDSRDAVTKSPSGVLVNGDAKRTYDSDSSESNHRTNVIKKVRRSSVLSLEYNEDNMDDDALIISTNGDGTISDAD